MGIGLRLVTRTNIFGGGRYWHRLFRLLLLRLYLFHRPNSDHQFRSIAKGTGILLRFRVHHNRFTWSALTVRFLIRLQLQITFGTYIRLTTLRRVHLWIRKEANGTFVMFRI